MTQLDFSYSRSGSFTPLPLGAFVGGLTGTARATWPVWRDSTRKEVKFQPLPKKQAVKLYHEARRFERQTRAAAPKGHQDGALGRNGLAVLHALIFDFLNFATGKLFPSIASIAHAANISARSVSRGLVRLKECGVVHWLRRCAEDWQDGRFVLRQETNAYGILPATQWRGYAPKAGSPRAAIWHMGRSSAPARRAHPRLPREGAGLAHHVARLGVRRERSTGLGAGELGAQLSHQGLKTPCFIGLPACPCILTKASFL